jgi:hypothetical protein
VVGREVCAVPRVGEQAVVGDELASGTLTVNPASLWHRTKRASGRGLARSTMRFVGTPVNVLSSRTSG